MIANQPWMTNPPPNLPPAFAWMAEAPFYQAGLAGYSDAAMRLVARRHGSPYCVTEAMLDLFLLNGGKRLKEAELSPEDHPIAGQLMGSHPQEIAAGAKILLSLGYDVIDINLACPVKKIKKKCRGGHLLSEPAEAIAILDAVRQAVGDAAPLTVKLRRAYDDSPEMEAAFYEVMEAVIRLGYFSATVHGRTVQQKYLGPSKWSFLADLTRRYPGFPIMGSGDIFSPQAIFQMIEQTGVRAVSVARGCIGNPWVFRQARQMMAGRTPRPPSIAEQRQVLLEHFELSLALHGEKPAGRMMRKFGIKFSRHHPMGQEVSRAFIAVQSLREWNEVLDRYYGPAMEHLEPADIYAQLQEGQTAEAEEEDCNL